MAARDLRLQVVLAALDKASGPLKRIMQGSKGVSAALRDSHQHLRQLNQQQRQMDGFRKMEAELGDTGLKLQNTRRRVAELQAQLNQAGTPTRKLTRELKDQTRQIGFLLQTENRQRAALDAQRRSLSAAGIDTNRLGVHQRELARDMEATNGRINSQRAQLAKLNRAQEMATKIHRAGMSAAAHGAGMAFAGQRALRAEMLPLAQAMAFESAMADVRKVVDFPTPQAFKEMSWDVQDLSRRLPMLPEDLAAIVAAAGQAGIARRELLGFAEDAAKMGVAFDTTAAEAGQTMATWRTAFRMLQPEVVELADKINYLGNTGPASVAKISDVVNRIGALGDVAGLKSGPLAALGATVAGMGIESEVSATGIKNLLLTLASGEGATLRQRKAFAALSLDATKVATALQDDAGGAILMVLRRIRELPKAAQAAKMTQLFGRESIGAIAPLLTNLELLEKNLGKVADAQQYGGSMGKEYASRVATSENALQLMKNTAVVVSQSIGETLLPDFKTLAERTSVVVGRVVDWVRANPELTRTLARLVIGGTALITVLGGITVSAGIGAMAFSQIHKAVTLLTGGNGLGALLGRLGALARGALPMLLNVGRMLLPVLGGISAPILLIGVAVAAVAALVWKYWGPIKAFMTGVWEGIVQAVKPALQEVMAALAPLAPVWNVISVAMGKAWNWIKQLFTPFQATNAQLQAANANGRSLGVVIGAVLGNSFRMLARIISGTISVFRSVYATVVNVIGGIRGYVQGAWSVITGIFSGDGGKIRAGLLRMWEGVNQILSGWPAKMMQAGVDMLSGLVRGIQSMLGKVGDAITGVGSGIVGKFKSLLGIHSPSRVFAQLGGYTMAGYVGGLQRGQPAALRAMGAFGDRMRQVGAGVALGAIAAPGVALDRRPPLAPPRPAAAVAGDTYHITIHASGDRAEDIQRAVREALEQVQRDKAARQRSRLSDD